MGRALGKTVDRLINELKCRGFIVQRLNAVTTNSIYLKLDYGVANSIRISDHKGKKHLSYRYNVMLNEKETRRYKDYKGFDRFIYPVSEIDSLIDHIEMERDEKYSKWGIDRYQSFVEKNMEEGHDKPGFWQKAVVV